MVRLILIMADMNIQDKILLLMLKKDMSQRDLAKRSGVSLRQISYFLTGQKEIGIFRLQLILEALGYEIKLIRKRKKATD